MSQKQTMNIFERLASGLDRAVGLFSPEAEAKRKYFRFISSSMLGSYRGADRGRLRGNWIPGGGSADQDMVNDLPALRERSRDLVRNDGIASGAMDTIVTNIIGTGVNPQSRIDKEALKVDQDYANNLQKQMEKIWKRWCPTADASGRMNFYEMEELIERNRFVNGEAIAVPLRIHSSPQRRPYNLAIQVIESDRLDTPSDLQSNKNIRLGVEQGEYGDPRGYWIRKTHPGDMYFTAGSRGNTSGNYIRYPAFNDMGDFNFFHLYHVKRSGQSRGEPFFSPVINIFKDRVDYMDAELVSARVAACFAVFIKREAGYQDGLSKTEEEDGKRVERLSPGMIERMRPGESMEGFAPNRPGGTFGIFTERILRDIASGLNIPYEILSKDFSRSNYSNTRAALLEARRFFKMQQIFVASKFCQPIFMMLMEEAYLKGELPILDFYSNRDAYVSSTKWITPGWEWIDPENEVNASVEAVNNNLSTLAGEAASRGEDHEEILEQRAQELKTIKELEEKYGIKMTPTDKVVDPKNEKPKKKTNKKPQPQEQPAPAYQE